MVFFRVVQDSVMDKSGAYSRLWKARGPEIAMLGDGGGQTKRHYSKKNYLSVRGKWYYLREVLKGMQSHKLHEGQQLYALCSPSRHGLCVVALGALVKREPCALGQWACFSPEGQAVWWLSPWYTFGCSEVVFPLVVMQVNRETWQTEPNILSGFNNIGLITLVGF